MTITALKASLVSASNGRRFTTEEDQIIVDMMTDAATNGTTVSVAAIRNALKDHNQNGGFEARTRAAVSNAIERLAKAERVNKEVLAKESNGREPYTQEEDNVILAFCEAAEQAGQQVTLPEIHKALLDSGKSPKPRSVPSVRAHLQNMIKKAEADETEETEEDESDIA